MKYIDFFSGIGGFHLGFKMAGHVCAGFCEIDKHAARSYKAMHLMDAEEYNSYLEETEAQMLRADPHPDLRSRKWKNGLMKTRREYIDRIDPGNMGIWHASDIKSVYSGELPDADIYCFGFPCQSFSVAGRRRGFEDTRGTLFFEVMRLAQARHPRYLVAENVPGLFSHDGGRTFGAIIDSMAELGYSVEWQTFNSRHYVPQNRLRVYIIGHFGGFSGQQIFPIRGDGEAPDEQPEEEGITIPGVRESSGQDTPSEIPIPVHSANKMKTRQNGNRFKMNSTEMFTLTTRDMHGIAVIGGLQQNQALRTDGLSPCLTEAMGKGGGQTPLIIEPEENIPSVAERISGESGIFGLCIGESERFITSPTKDVAHTLKAMKADAAVTDGLTIRKLTPLECFRLQGFPDELYHRAASINSEGQLYKQAVNSVTVPVIYEIAKAIADAESLDADGLAASGLTDKI
jgi:DNA (cytosine-5)-methyltransferase 1